VVADNVTAWNVGVSAAAYNVGGTLLDERFFGSSDETGFGDRVDTRWQKPRKTASSFWNFLLTVKANSVFGHGRAANVPAYSQPITPAPITTNFFGKAFSSRISFESWIRSSSKWNSAGRNGEEPVAIEIFSP